MGTNGMQITSQSQPEGCMIKNVAIVLAYLALSLGADRAAAQTRLWCLIMPGLATNCIYYTFEQCQAARIGSSTYCGQNPYPGDVPTGTTTKGRRQ
jgi:Protein of unknown function (DUF3551)